MARYNEFKSCCALVRWWAFACRMYKVPENLLFHIPNQAAGNARRGANLKAMGVRAGTPDYFLAVPRGGFHGLFIEQKTSEGKASTEQTAAILRLQEQGYIAVICISTDEARTTIESYLKQK